MTEPLVPAEFAVPTGLTGAGFRLEPLGPQHNERDHQAWMSSIDHIRTTPGFPDGNWPSPMSLERNLEDLERHANDFAARKGFTYSVHDGDDVIGCLYIYPSDEPGHDADVLAWVTAQRAHMDAAVWHTISQWLVNDWPFENPDHNGR